MIDVAQRQGITMFTEPLRQKIKKLSKDKGGNFALIAALVAPLLLAGGGLAIDLANQTALKTRFQAASDSVSLAVATRIANEKLTVTEAEAFGIQLLEAQMANDYSRFSNLKIEPLVEITEVINGGVSTWDIKVGGKATQDTTPFAAFLNKTTTSATVTSGAQSGKEDVQGALSMAIVVDVSGSMGWELPISTKSTEDSLKVNAGVAKTIITKVSNMVKTYDLSTEELEYIITNYSFWDCNNLTNAQAKTFFSNIGLLSDEKKWKAKQICKNVNFAEKKGVSTSSLFDNIAAVAASGKKTIKIDALKSAASELFAQFDDADKEKKYVRTGLSAYSSSVKGTTKMEWGTNAAKNYTSGMKASGGTASTKSVQWAFDQLASSPGTEDSAHLAKNGQDDPDRFILFMTDGSNNNGADDTKTKAICDNAKSDGIRVFSVAFAAPTKGEKLLKYCASDPESDHYFDPETAAELIAAFKNIGTKTTPKKSRLTN